MLDLTSMTAEQQDALFHVFEVAADNPLEQMKMDFLLAALQFKEWVEKNMTGDREQFEMMWSGVEAQTNRIFQEAQIAISQKTGIPLVQ
jgi:hypothetical protein